MKYYRYEFNLVLLNIVAVILFVFMIFITYFITGSINFIDSLRMIDIVYLILWMMLHELLHGVGFLTCGEAKIKDIYLGAAIEKGIFYCMCKKEISKKNILIALMFPFVFIGVVTYILGIAFSIKILILLSVFNISGAAGDLMMFLDIVRMPNNTKYIDLDSITGYTLLSKNDLKEVRTYSSYIVESGKYTNKIKPKDFTRIKISKISKIFIVIILLFAIISLF